MERAGRLLSKLKIPAGAMRPDDLARAAWAPAVGSKVAAHTQAVWFSGARLVVEVEDAIWQRQLAVLRGQILKRLEEVLGHPLVAEIEFRLRPRRRMPQLAETPRFSQDEADQIPDPVLRSIYKQQRRRRSA
ncbi:MAG: DUF721 domain-containing protein [Bryobacterales bacterium]|nr:DUF721 domain-containing protein [Bryobacterales bacterium]